MQFAKFQVGPFGLDSNWGQPKSAQLQAAKQRPLVAREANGRRWEFKHESYKVVLTRFGRTGKVMGELRPKEEKEYPGPNGGLIVVGQVAWTLKDDRGGTEEEVMPVRSAFDACGNLVSVEITEPVSHTRTEYGFESGELSRLVRYYCQKSGEQFKLIDEIRFDASGARQRKEEWKEEDGRLVQTIWRCDATDADCDVIVGQNTYRDDCSLERTMIRIPFPDDPNGRSVNIVTEHEGICQTSIVHCAGYLISKTNHGMDSQPEVSVEHSAQAMKSYKYSLRELESIGGKVVQLTKELEDRANGWSNEATISTRTDRNGDLTVSVQNARAQAYVLKKKACGTPVYFKSPSGEWTSLDGFNWYRSYGLGKEREFWRGSFAISADGTVIDGRHAGEKDGFILVHRTDGSTEKIRGSAH